MICPSVKMSTLWLCPRVDILTSGHIILECRTDHHASFVYCLLVSMWHCFSSRQLPSISKQLVSDLWQSSVIADTDLVCVSRCLLTGLDFRQVLHQATTAEHGMRSPCHQTTRVRQVSASFIYRVSWLGLGRYWLSDYRSIRLLHYRMTIGPDSFSPIVVPIVRLAAVLSCDWYIRSADMHLASRAEVCLALPKYNTTSD